MTAPHRPSEIATAIAAILAVLLVDALFWLALALARRLRRPRRWPKPRRSWLRDVYGEAEQRRQDRRQQ